VSPNHEAFAHTRKKNTYSPYKQISQRLTALNVYIFFYSRAPKFSTSDPIYNGSVPRFAMDAEMDFNSLTEKIADLWKDTAPDTFSKLPIDPTRVSPEFLNGLCRRVKNEIVDEQDRGLLMEILNECPC